MKYMVMECHLSYAVVLDENGRFQKVANRHYEVGQTVTDIIPMQISETVSKKKNTYKWLYTLAAMAACLVLMVTSVFQMEQITYAFVYMTINPEVRLDVNRNDVVVGLESLNLDGENLISGYDYKKKELDLVMNELVERAIDIGYLHEGGHISLILDADDDEWVISHKDSLVNRLNEDLDKKISVTIEVTGKKEQSNQIIIPVIPQESGYSESDYSETKSESEVPEKSEPEDSHYSNSDYDDGQSDYEASDDDGQSDYEKLDDDGQSDYEASDDDGQSDYEELDDDGQSDYEAPDDDGQSDYEAPDDDGWSEYEDVSEYEFDND